MISAIKEKTANEEIVSSISNLCINSRDGGLIIVGLNE